jgi:hypothetical protein
MNLFAFDKAGQFSPVNNMKGKYKNIVAVWRIPPPLLVPLLIFLFDIPPPVRHKVLKQSTLRECCVVTFGNSFREFVW